MTTGRVIDFGVARARLRGEGWAALESELVEVPDDEAGHEVCSPGPRVCPECETGRGLHADDCSRSGVTAVARPVLTLAPPPAQVPVQLRLGDEDDVS